MFLAPFFFTLDTADCKYKSDTCHIHKYRDEIAILACVRNGQEGKYRDLTSAFFDWSEENCLILKTTKTKEMIVDFGKSNSPLQPVNIDGFDIEVVG